MKYFFEGTSIGEEKLLRSWLDIIVDLLGITSSDQTVHIHLIGNAEELKSGGKAFMYPIIIPGNRIYIGLDIDSKDRWLELLSHEMVHVKQVVRGEHKIVSVNSATGSWLGKEYNMKFVSFMCNIDYEFYRELPWEAEAFDRMYDIAETVQLRLGSISLKEAA